MNPTPKSVEWSPSKFIQAHIKTTLVCCQFATGDHLYTISEGILSTTNISALPFTKYFAYSILY